MADPTPKRANSPRVGNAAAGGGAGLALSQMLVELVNRALEVPLTPEFQASLGLVLTIVCGYWAGWMTRDKDE